MKLLIPLTLLGLAAALSSAAEEADYQSQVRKLLPVAYWSFDGEKPSLGEVDGKLEFLQPGPAAKQFKTFRDDNRAVRFRDGKGLIRLEDVGPGKERERRFPRPDRRAGALPADPHRGTADRALPGRALHAALAGNGPARRQGAGGNRRESRKSGRLAETISGAG